VSGHRRHLREGVFLWIWRGIWSRRTCWGAVRFSELAAAHGVHRSWIYKLIARYRDGGYEALEPRSRRPRSCKHGTTPEIVERIVQLRERLQQDGHDAGAATIAYHLAQEINGVPSISTIWRILRRQGLVVPQPQKRPRSSLIRFEADLPNEMWQADITHWQLAAGEHVEILNMIDDHSRLFLASQAFPTTKAQEVVNVSHKAASLHGLPACLLSDNGAVFTATPRKGKVLLQTELERLGIANKKLTALPPPNLRKDRAATPNTQALPRPPTRRKKPSENCKPSSTPSPTTTTRSGPTEP
jgi:transposase